MDTNIDFKNIWKQQTSNKPDMEELLGRLKKFKNENLRRLVVTNLLLIATCTGIAFVWYRYQPELATTKIGIVLVIAAMVIFLLAYNKLFMVFYKIDNTQSNSEYLQNLYVVKNKQKFMQTTMLNIYFIMLFTGLILYMYEYTSKMSFSSSAIAYIAIVAWAGFNWFYLRPRTIKNNRLNLTD